MRSPGVLGENFRRYFWQSFFLLLAGIAMFGSGCAGITTGSPSGSSSGNPGTLSISSVAATNATLTSITITWQTSAPANSQIEYGTSSSYGSLSSLDSSMVSSHQE